MDMLNILYHMKFYLSNANKGTILNAILKQCEGFIMLHEYTYILCQLWLMKNLLSTSLFRVIYY